MGDLLQWAFHAFTSEKSLLLAISKKHFGKGRGKTPALSQCLGIVIGSDTFAAIGIWCFHSLGIVGIQSDCCDTVALEGLEIKEVAGDGFIVAHGYVKSSW